MTETSRPRYIGSLTECHGEIIGVHPCDCSPCVHLPEWEQQHVTLRVFPDAGGPAVTLKRVRFASFTGRP